MGNKAHDPNVERVFVRGITGNYGLKNEMKRLRSLPRVVKGKDLKLDGGPQHFSRHYMEPEDGRTQTLHIHLEEYAPGGKTSKHGHVNEHNNCVHQHFNGSATEPARSLVLKTKPMFLFINMLFQETVEKEEKNPSATQGNFVPRDEEENYNHPAE
jgi:hypothetical protein